MECRSLRTCLHRALWFSNYQLVIHPSFTRGNVANLDHVRDTDTPNAVAVISDLDLRGLTLADVLPLMCTVLLVCQPSSRSRVTGYVPQGGQVHNHERMLHQFAADNVVRSIII
jgi:hypothetical protein